VVEEPVTRAVFVRVKLAGVPQLCQVRALPTQFGDQPLHSPVGRVARRRHATVRDQTLLLFGELLAVCTAAGPGPTKLRHSPLLRRSANPGSHSGRPASESAPIVVRMATIAADGPTGTFQEGDSELDW